MTATAFRPVEGAEPIRSRSRLAVLFVALIALAVVFGLPAPLRNPTVCRWSPAAQVETVPVVVAAVKVSPFTALKAEMLVVRDFPKDLVPPGALSRVEDAIDRA